MRLTDELMAEWIASEWAIREQFPAVAPVVMAQGPGLVPGAEYARLVRDWAFSGVANCCAARQRDIRSVDLGGDADRAAIEALRQEMGERIPLWRRVLPGGRALDERRAAACAVAGFLLTGLTVTIADADVAERLYQEASDRGRWRVGGEHRTAQGKEVVRVFVPEPDAYSQREPLLAELRAVEASVHQEQAQERERVVKVQALLAQPHGQAWAAAVEAGAARRDGRDESGGYSFDLPDVLEDVEYLYPAAAADRLSRWGVSARMWLQPWLDGWRWDAAAELAGEAAPGRPSGHIWDSAMNDVLYEPFGGFDPETIVIADSPGEAVAFLAQDGEHLFGKAGVMVVGGGRARDEVLQAVRDHANGDGGGGSRVLVVVTDPSLAGEVTAAAIERGAKVDSRMPDRGRTWAEQGDLLAVERGRDPVRQAPALPSEKERIAARRAELGFPVSVGKGLSR